MKNVKNWLRRGSAEFVGMAYSCIIIVFVFIHMVAFITYSRSLNNLSDALTVAARAAAICETEKDAKTRANRIMDSAITDINVKNAKILIKPVGATWDWKGGNQAKIVLEADVKTIAPYVVGGKVRKSELITIEGNIELDFEHMKNLPFDPYTPRTEGQVRQMIAYAKYWLDKGLVYGSNWDGGDPDFRRSEPLSVGGISDCSWFVFHVLEKFGYVKPGPENFIRSFYWGNRPETYPGAYNIGSDISKASPGDIIATGKGTWSDNSHVAIYIGGGKVIEMTSANGLVISNAPSNPREIIHYGCNPYHPD